VAPHNPSGPVSTAAGVQVCAVIRNLRLLELQWGEVEWRGDVLEPREVFENGSIGVPDRPGFGVELNDRVVRAHPV
jgi:galactonate dehydratase